MGGHRTLSLHALATPWLATSYRRNCPRTPTMPSPTASTCTIHRAFHLSRHRRPSSPSPIRPAASSYREPRHALLLPPLPPPPCLHPPHRLLPHAPHHPIPLLPLLPRSLPLCHRRPHPLRARFLLLLPAARSTSTCSSIGLPSPPSTSPPLACPGPTPTMEPNSPTSSTNFLPPTPHSSRSSHHPRVCLHSSPPPPPLAPATPYCWQPHY